MSADERTGWECRFCSEKLQPQPQIGWQRLLWIVPVRKFRCPHCFNTYQKPVALIAAIPLVGRLFCEKRGVAANVSGMISGAARRGRSSQRNYVNAGWFVRFARWTGSVESKTADFVGRILRTLSLKILWPLHWFSKTFLRSNDKSPSSNRSRSKRRSRSHDDA